MHLFKTIFAFHNISFLIIYLSTTISSVAQHQTDTIQHIDSSAILYFTQNDFLNFNVTTLRLDTTLSNFQIYDPVKKSGKFYATLGNIGLAHKNLVFSPTFRAGFDLGIHSFDQYLFSSNHLKYYSTPKPYTELYYVMGKLKEQFFRINHSQKIGRNLHVGVNFRIIDAFGNFQRQKSTNNNVAFKTSYFTNNKRYGIIASYLFNSIKAEENGGLMVDSIFEKKLESDTKQIAVNLTAAENRLKNSHIQVNHYYQIAKPDSSGVEKNRSNIFNPGILSQSISYSKQSLTYDDKNPNYDYYPTVYYDSLPSNTELKLKQLENAFSWTNTMDQTSPLSLTLGLKYQYTEVTEILNWISSQSTNYLHFIYSGALIIRPSQNMNFKVNAEWINGDINNNDHQIKATFNNHFTRNDQLFSLLELWATSSSQSQPWFFQYYNSNYFQWDENFNKTSMLAGGLSYHQSFWKTGVNYYQIGDYVYFAQDTLPAQFQGNIDLFHLYIDNNFQTPTFDFNTKVIYQNQSNKEIIRLPTLMIDFSAYYQKLLFKKALRIQIGLDAFYNTSYYADNYMGAIRSFYLQDEKKINNLLILDAVLKFQVKTARFFLAWKHFNSLFGENDFYFVPHHPIQDARINFGISWTFHD